MDQSYSTSVAVCTALMTLLILVVSSVHSVQSYTFGPTPLSRFTSQPTRYSPRNDNGERIHRRREDGSALTLYLFPSSPSESAANLRVSRRNTVRRDTKLPAMSQSVLATCDTLPGASTAHGLLSPEVVMRIADNHDLDQDGALYLFLKTYKSRGPMACLPMLGDPNVLPELTRAMRDIA
jgi:hypothetical protein